MRWEITEIFIYLVPGRNVNQKIAIFQFNFMAKNEDCFYFVIMYQSKINYGIYTS